MFYFSINIVQSLFSKLKNMKQQSNPNSTYNKKLEQNPQQQGMTEKSNEKSEEDQVCKLAKSIDLPVVHKAVRDDHQMNSRQQIFYRIQQEQEKQKENFRIRRYDYLNKYNQHQISCMNKMDAQKLKEHTLFKGYQRKSRQELGKEDQKKYIGESLQKKATKTGSIYFLKRSGKRKSNERSSSSSIKRKKSRKSPPPYFAHLQAYQNNILKTKDILQESEFPTPPSEIIINPLSILGHIQQNNSIGKLLSKIPISSSVTNGLAKQLTYQNEILKGQTIQYRCIVAKLSVDLKIARQELLIMKQCTLNEKQQFEKIIGNLQQINSTLEGYKQKYEILAKQMVQKNSNQLKNKSFDCQNKENQDNHIELKPMAKIKSNIKKRWNNHQQSFGYEDSMYNSLLQRLSKLLVDKIQNSFAINNNDNFSQLTHEEIIDKVEKLVSKNRKYEDFVFNISEMYRKIQRSNKDNENDQNEGCKWLQHMEPTLRQLWKWLKQLGYAYNLIQQIKPLLIQKVGMAQSKNIDLRELFQIIILHF